LYRWRREAPPPPPQKKIFSPENFFAAPPPRKKKVVRSACFQRRLLRDLFVKGLPLVGRTPFFGALWSTFFSSPFIEDQVSPPVVFAPFYQKPSVCSLQRDPPYETPPSISSSSKPPPTIVPPLRSPWHKPPIRNSAHGPKKNPPRPN